MRSIEDEGFNSSLNIAHEVDVDSVFFQISVVTFGRKKKQFDETDSGEQVQSAEDYQLKSTTYTRIETYKISSNYTNLI